jgi:aspartate/methionine/tyrosine aminotransferase
LVQKKEDGKIYLKSEFSDRSAVGFSILLVEDKVYQGDKEGKKFYQEKLILLEEKLEKNGELTVVEPEVAYFIVLDVPGYVTEIKGL